MVEKENAFAALNLLWERRNMPDVLDDIATLQHEKRPIEELFEAADQDAWQRLKDAKNKIHLRGPMRASPEPCEVYQPLRFDVVPADPWLRGNYLFQHGLEYQWNIQVARNTWFLERSKPAPEEALTPVTHEPRVLQYAPWPGRMTASVTLVFRDQEIELPSAKPAHQEIDTSSVFRWRRAFSRMEYLSSFLALILGVATGLSTYYFGNATFGSAKDYLTLLLWGAGADQAKNFVQLLGGSAPAVETPPAKK